MKKKSLFRHNRLIFITLLSAGVFFSYGCQTFGTFANLKQDQSTSEDVRELLGEPEEIRSEENYDIWKYTFLKGSKARPLSNSQKALETEISFQDGVMKEYEIIVVTRMIPEKKGKKPGYGNVQPGVNPGALELDPKAARFLEEFDKNRDRQITKNEYSGPPKLFILIDSNHNDIIEVIELKKFSFKK